MLLRIKNLLPNYLKKRFRQINLENGFLLYDIHNKLKDNNTREGYLDEIQLAEQSTNYQDYETSLWNLIHLGYITKKDNYFKIIKDLPQYVQMMSWREKALYSFQELKYKDLNSRCYFSDEYESIRVTPNLYYDVTTIEGRPDYNTIEGLCFLSNNTSLSEQKIYRGFKFKNLSDGKFQVLLNWIYIMDNNITSHLLSVLLYQKGFKENIIIKYKALQKHLNESKENIILGLNELQKLNLLLFEELNSNKIIFTLNKKEVLKISPKFTELDDYDINVPLINQRYGLDIKTEKEKDEEREQTIKRRIKIQYPNLYS